MSFDSLARFYPALEYMAFAPALQQMRTRFVANRLTAKKILLAGEGDGRFLAELARLQSEADVDCIDASSRMLARARSRLNGDRSRFQSRINFIQADLRNYELPENRYDLVVTHFFLDCFNEKTLNELVPKLAASAKPGGFWLLSDFSLPSRGWRRLRATIWLNFLYAFFGAFARLETRKLIDPRPLIQKLGWQCCGAVTTQYGLLYSSLWQKTSAQITSFDGCCKITSTALVRLGTV